MAVENEIVRVAMHYSQPGAGDQMNVFHFRVTDGSQDDQSMLDGIENWVTTVWAVAWRELAATSAKLQSAEVDIITESGLVDRNIGGFLVDIAGVVGGDVVAAGVAAYILAYTANPKTRGSKYLPGLGEPIVDGGLLTVNGLADLAVCLVEYLADVDTGGDMVLSPGVPSFGAGIWYPFLSSGALETVPAYQRRRKVGVGI